MNNRVQQNELEERNLFPEKVARSLHIDADKEVAMEQADDSGNVGLMEEISLEEMFSRNSSPIEDESPTLNMRKHTEKPASAHHKNRAFDVELLAREIDALKKTGVKRAQDAHRDQESDFWKVLADEDQKLINEVTRKADEIELEMLEPVTAIDADENDRAYFIGNILEGSGRPLSEDTEDFSVVSVEGYRGLGPDTIIDYLSRRMASARKGAGDEKTAASMVPELEPLPESEPILELEPLLQTEIQQESGSFIEEPDENAVMLNLDEIVTSDPGNEAINTPGTVDNLFKPDESVHFDISNDDFHDESIADELAMLSGTDSNQQLSGILDEAGEEDETLRLSPDELLRVGDFNESSDFSESGGKNGDENELIEPAEDARVEIPVAQVDQEMPIPENFILTPVDLTEAERIAKEDILLLNENDLLEELGTSDIFQNDSNSHRKEQVQKYDEKKPEVRYAIPEGSSLSESHKASIEDDITSSQALVIEEDIAEIRKRYEPGQNTEVTEELVDITDQVMILDDEANVERVAETIPGEKRDDMKRLFRYLDGLFEKLPADVVRSFADSEYFNMYVKIMNDIGK